MTTSQPAAKRRTTSVAGIIVELLASAVNEGAHDARTRAELELSDEEIQAGLSAVVLRTRLALDLCAPPAESLGGNSPRRATRSSLLTLLPEVLDRVPARAREAGATSALLTDATLPFTTKAALAQWLRPHSVERLLEALRDPDDPETFRDAGVLYQELLEVRIRRLEARSICVRPRRAWISARDVLAEAPLERAKWLMARAALPKSAVHRLGAALAAADSEIDVFTALEKLRTPGTRVAAASTLVVEFGLDRRRSGSHFTPKALCRAVVERALGPLISGADSAALLRLRICDPSMGSGAFLEVCAELLGERLSAAWHAEGRTSASFALAMSAVVTRCLRGVDKDGVAVDLARWSLARLATVAGGPVPNLSGNLVVGDALVGSKTAADDDRLSPLIAALGAVASRFDWHRAFPDVFEAPAAGFDACVGNPPWIAYAGRAAQPLDDSLARFYLETNPAFGSYRTLHGLFVRRAAELLRPGGRLGFVLPTSVADLDGYGPTRRAHDVLAEVDHDLDDFGDGAFEGVFQPCMALTSTRRLTSTEAPGDAPWPLARSDLDAVGTGLLSRLSAHPTLDPDLFGERGFQTTGRDLAHIRRLEGPEPPFVVPIREGIDVQEFRLGPPRCFLDPVGLTGRFRQRDEWAQVRVLIRQTARYPIAALSDGVAFRNSILAGFGNDEWTPAALAAYLNSNPVRYFHFVRHRDARQGMPQLKIGHLRAMPAIGDPTARAALDALGRRLGTRNAGFEANDRAELDRLVFDALHFRPDERALVAKWAVENPVPKRRQGISRQGDRLW